MSPQDEISLVVFQECLNSIWAKLNNVSSSIGISDEIRLNTQLTIAISGVTP